MQTTKSRMTILLSFLFLFLNCFSIDSKSTLGASLLQFAEAQAMWPIGRSTEQNLTVSFRKIIKSSNYKTIKLRITCSSDYRATVNSKFLAHGPCVAAHDYYRIDEYDFKKLLNKNNLNILTLEVAGYNINSYYLLDQPSFVQAEIIADGEVIAATGSTDKNFETYILNQRKQKVNRYSFQRTFVEEYNFSTDYNDWKFNEKIEIISVDCELFTAHKLLARGVKYPDYSIKNIEKQLSKDTYQFDINSTGFLGATLLVTNPTTVTFYFSEVLNQSGEVPSDYSPSDDNKNKTQNYIVYHLEPGSYQVESFEPYVMKFVKVALNPEDCEVKEIFIRQYVNSDISRAYFYSDNEKLNLIYQAAFETYKQNALDIFMDCPSRERAGWLCDSYFTARTAFDLSGNTLIEDNFLENFMLPDSFKYLPKGMFPMCYPADHNNGDFIPNWSMWLVLELAEYQKRGGNQLVIDKFRPKIINLLNYFKAFENESGLLENLDRWIFVEWSKANDWVRQVNYPTNMLYAKALQDAATLYDLPELEKKSIKIKRAILDQSYNGAFLCDHANRENSKLVTQPNDISEVCQYYAFFFDIATPTTHPELWKKLITNFIPKRDPKTVYPNVAPANAFIGNFLRMEILSKNGLVNQLMKESFDNFSYMANITGTLWENVSSSASCNHGFASHVVRVFNRDILGVNSIDLKSKTIYIKFNTIDLKTCEGIIPIGKDVFKMKWKKTGNVIKYEIKVPKGYSYIVIDNQNIIAKKVNY